MRKAISLWLPSNFQIIGLVLLSIFAASEPVQSQGQPADQRRQREKFDPIRDPAKDLTAAVAVTSKSGQRILLDIGGEWCSWCRKLDMFFEQNEDVAAVLHKNFVVVKVNFSKENPNEKFLSQYPAIKGYPHIFVLDAAGKLLHSQSTGELESGDHHDHDKVLAFLKRWAPSPGRS
jgi:thioredoxin-related protein